MSSLFQYELDEQYIKQILQTKKLDYNEVAWDKFDRYMVSECPKSKSFIPKNMHLDISTHVLTIAAFTIGISAASFILFSNIKFDKSQQAVVKQDVVVNKVSNESTDKTVIAKKAETKTSIVAKPAMDKAPIKIETTSTLGTNEIVNNDKKKETKLEEKPTLANSVVKENPLIPKEIPVVEETITQELVASATEDTHKKKRKKRKTTEVEELQAITTTSLPIIEEKEPELEIK